MVTRDETSIFEGFFQSLGSEILHGTSATRRSPSASDLDSVYRGGEFDVARIECLRF